MASRKRENQTTAQIVDEALEEKLQAPVNELTERVRQSRMESLRSLERKVIYEQCYALVFCMHY